MEHNACLMNGEITRFFSSLHLSHNDERKRERPIAWRISGSGSGDGVSAKAERIGKERKERE